MATNVHSVNTPSNWENKKTAGEGGGRFEPVNQTTFATKKMYIWIVYSSRFVDNKYVMFQAQKRCLICELFVYTPREPSELKTCGSSSLRHAKNHDSS